MVAFYAAADAGAVLTRVFVIAARFGNNRAAADADHAVPAVLAAADAGAPVAADGFNLAVVDGNGSPIAAVLSAADARTVVAALRKDDAAVDHNGRVLAFAGASAADAGAPVVSDRMDIAAVDGDHGVAAFFVLFAVADARAAAVSTGAHDAAVDGNGLKAAVFVIAAADARAVFAVGLHNAAVDHDMPADGALLAADARRVVCCHGAEHTGGIMPNALRGVALAVNGQRAVLGDVNAALDAQVEVVADDQAHVSPHGNPVFYRGVNSHIRRYIGAGCVPLRSVFAAHELVGIAVDLGRVVYPALRTVRLQKNDLRHLRKRLYPAAETGNQHDQRQCSADRFFQFQIHK